MPIVSCGGGIEPSIMAGLRRGGGGGAKGWVEGDGSTGRFLLVGGLSVFRRTLLSMTGQLQLEKERKKLFGNCFYHKKRRQVT